MKQKLLIYKATNTISGKSYIGKTNDLKRRKRGHHDYSTDNRISKHSQIFHKAINSYGKEAFEWTVLAECDNHDELNRLEIKYVEEYSTLTPHGYNMTKGGGGMFGYHLSPETKKSISDKIKELHKNPEYQEKTYPKLKGRTPPNKGMAMSEEQKLKVSKARKAVHADPDYVNPNVGQKREGAALENLKKGYETRELPTGDEWQKAHSDQYTPEVRAKMRQAKLGKKPANTKQVCCNETGETFAGLTEAAKALGIARQSVFLQIKGKLKKVGGKYTFKYLKPSAL